MRLLFTWLAGALTVCVLALVAPGCGENTMTALEKPPEVKKQLDPMVDMPGYKDMQDTLKKKK